MGPRYDRACCRHNGTSSRGRESKAAYRLLWLAVIFDVLAFGIGFDWDRRWHATHAFEDFFSPPHLVIYSMHLCATITLAYIAFTPDLRHWFGPTSRFPIIPFPIRGAIGLARPSRASSCRP